MYYLHWEDWPTALSYPSLPPITPPSLDSTLHVAYTVTTGTLYLQRRHTYGRNLPPLPMKSKLSPKDTKLSFDTAQTEDSANGNS